MRGQLAELVNRFTHIFRELGKFGIVGVVSYVIDTGVLKVCLSASVNPILSKTISTVIAATLAFVGNRFWTWRHRERSGLHREYGLYFVFNAIGLGIALLCLWASHYGLGSVWAIFQSDNADIVSANVVGMAFGTVFRFWSYRRYVFRDQVVPLSTR
jgi:putative flippase GtrA